MIDPVKIVDTATDLAVGSIEAIPAVIEGTAEVAVAAIEVIPDIIESVADGFFSLFD